MPPYGTRKDANHDALSNAARERGWFVVDTFQFAQYCAGWPDAVWAKPGRTVLVEYKTEDGTLTPAEEAFAAAWPGEWHIARNIEDVVAITEKGRAL